MSDGIVIAGGGLVAQRAAETLRRVGYAGKLRVIAAEPHLPYDRPPLSKQVLSGERDEGSIAFRPSEWYAENEVDLLRGVSASALRPRDRQVHLSDATVLRYDQLLIATGSRPRRLPVLAGYHNVHELRTVDDTRALRRALGAGKHLTIIGAGFIGMEVAATARRLGTEVTLIEACAHPLENVLGERLGGWFADLHRSEGVELLARRHVNGVYGNGSVRSLTLSDGTVVETDAVVVGVGVEPEVEWLAGTPLVVGGVRVDTAGRTTVPNVFAAGDVTVSFDPVTRSYRPGSHWEAAARQAARAARAMLGCEPGRLELASFWTDLYGIRIQYLGHAGLADQVQLEGDPCKRNFTATYVRGGRPVAALLVDRPRSLPDMRELIGQGRR